MPRVFPGHDWKLRFVRGADGWEPWRVEVLLGPVSDGSEEEGGMRVMVVVCLLLGGCASYTGGMDNLVDHYGLRDTAFHGQYMQ
jgi:hypothetical protein